MNGMFVVLSLYVLIFVVAAIVVVMLVIRTCSKLHGINQRMETKETTPSDGIKRKLKEQQKHVEEETLRKAEEEKQEFPVSELQKSDDEQQLIDEEEPQKLQEETHFQKVEGNTWEKAAKQEIQLEATEQQCEELQKKVEDASSILSVRHASFPQKNSSSVLMVHW